MFIVSIPVILLISFLMALYSLKQELNKEKINADNTIFSTKELYPNQEVFL